MCSEHLIGLFFEQWQIDALLLKQRCELGPLAEGLLKHSRVELLAELADHVELRLDREHRANVLQTVL